MQVCAGWERDTATRHALQQAAGLMQLVRAGPRTVLTLTLDETRLVSSVEGVQDLESDVLAAVRDLGQPCVDCMHIGVVPNGADGAPSLAESLMEATSPRWRAFMCELAEAAPWLRRLQFGRLCEAALPAMNEQLAGMGLRLRVDLLS